jgi:hypothetical protein
MAQPPCHPRQAAWGPCHRFATVLPPGCHPPLDYTRRHLATTATRMSPTCHLPATPACYPATCHPIATILPPGRQWPGQMAACLPGLTAAIPTSPTHCHYLPATCHYSPLPLATLPPLATLICYLPCAYLPMASGTMATYKQTLNLAVIYFKVATISPLPHGYYPLTCRCLALCMPMFVWLDFVACSHCLQICVLRVFTPQMIQSTYWTMGECAVLEHPTRYRFTLRGSV